MLNLVKFIWPHRERQQLNWASRPEDYAAWDQTYVYMATRNAQYTDQEMSVATLAGLGVNYLAILDVTGRQIFSRSTDLAGKTEVAAPQGVGPYLRPTGPLLKPAGTQQGVAVLFCYPRGPCALDRFRF